MRILALLILTLATVRGQGLIPYPKSLAPREGQFLVDARTAVIAPQEFEDHARLIASAVQRTTGFLHRVMTPEQVGLMRIKRTIRLSLGPPDAPTGSYRLEVTPEGVSLKAPDRLGLMHGAQTFVNLLPVAPKPMQRALINACLIEDGPGVKRRVFHLDVGAHLFPTDDLKSLVDWLSFHKLNELHLQLNNDHGWRMESKTFPKLHQIGSVRPSTPPYGDRTGSDSEEYGGYYTRKNLIDLVEHARSRGVVIIPAFALNSGASALIASYPELGDETVKVASTWESRQVGMIENEGSLAFLEKLFGEVATIFPADEVRIEGPESPLHQKLRAILQKHERKLFNPTSLPTTDFSLYPRPAAEELLRSPETEAEGGFNPVSTVYQLQPGPEGAQATLRTQFVHDYRKLEYLVFPRIAAFSEACWLPASPRKYDEFRTRLKAMQSRYRTLGLFSSVPYHAPAARVLYDARVTTSLKMRRDHDAIFAFDGNEETFLWSQDGVSENDHWTLELPWPATGQVRINTGTPGSESGILESGVLEQSNDGKVWTTLVPFIAGRAETDLENPPRFLRIRATGEQETALILHEVNFSEALLMPLHREVRTLKLPITNEMVELTFKADFREHPEIRNQVMQVRKIFFEQWLTLGMKLGVAHEKGTPRVFELKAGEPGQLAPPDVRRWTLGKLIPHLQSYPDTAPAWFQTGLVSFLLEEFPKDPDRTKALDGGPSSAAFLKWLASKHTDQLLSNISGDCRRGRYRDSLWKTMTGQTLAELTQAYREGGN
jgi:hexosaminidase